MDNKESYIGSPCAVVMCVDAAGVRISGRLYHAYKEGAVSFFGMENAFPIMESFFNRIRCPFPDTETHSFFYKKIGRDEDRSQQGKRMMRVMKDDELLKEHGDRGTFIIRVQYRQHSSWQGVVTWSEKHKTVPFRSALELMKMIDEALGSEEPDLDEYSLVDNEG